MEIRIYSSTLDLVGILENQTSLLWTPKYYETGTFELHAPITADNLAILRRGNLVTMAGKPDAGIIEDLKLSETPIKNELIAQGRFLTGYFYRRLVRGSVAVSSTAEKAMYDLIKGATAIPLLEIGDPNGFAGNVSGVITWANLGKILPKLARAANVGYRVRPDFNEKKLYFETYIGTDRSVEQAENNRVIFSENYDNISRAEYHTIDQDYYNVAYVTGKDANENEIKVEVGKTTLEGLERREMYVDASAINMNDLGGISLTDAMKQSGRDALNSHVLAETFECDTDVAGNYRYGVDWDLGDIVTVNKKSWDIKKSLRVTEVLETYEYGSVTVTPTFGSPLPVAIDWKSINY